MTDMDDQMVVMDGTIDTAGKIHGMTDMEIKRLIIGITKPSRTATAKAMDIQLDLEGTALLQVHAVNKTDMPQTSPLWLLRLSQMDLRSLPLLVTQRRLQTLSS